MTRPPILSAAAMLVALLSAAPAQAVPRGQTWIASSGADTGSCQRGSPCLTLAYALTQTAPGGEINCADKTTQFTSSSLTISNSIIIDCTGTPSVLQANGSAFFTVNVGATDVVTLRGLDIESYQQVTFAAGLFGVNFVGGGALHIENCTFRNFTNAGIKFQPSASGSQLVVSDTVLSNSGSGSTGGGIIVNPQSGGNAVVLLERVLVANNVYGIVADGSGSTAGINMTIANSDAHRNTQDGIVATTVSGMAPIGILIKNTRSLSNNIGIRATGPGVTVRADNASVSGNGAGLVVNLGASLLSFGNNNIVANGVNGAFSGSVALQ